jgi:hypothetical protein
LVELQKIDMGKWPNIQAYMGRVRPPEGQEALRPRAGEVERSFSFPRPEAYSRGGRAAMKIARGPPAFVGRALGRPLA